MARLPIVFVGSLSRVWSRLFAREDVPGVVHLHHFSSPFGARDDVSLE